MQEENVNSPEGTQVTEPVFTEPTTNVQKNTGIGFNLNTLLIIVLFIGLGVLYFLHFTAPKPEAVAPQAAAALQKSGERPLSVVFVNIDSLNERYDFVKNLRNDLLNTGKRLQTEVLSEQSSLEKEAAEFQKQVAANAIPEDKARGIYENLMQRQQALMEKKERYTEQVANQELSMNIRLLDTVTNFLKRYNRTYKFDYILTHKTAGDILVANDTLDITTDVIKQLNSEYSARKK
jgi:outer membrane protein